MQLRHAGPILVIVVIVAVVAFVVATSIGTWRDRVNPQTVNQPPATQPVPPIKPASS